MILFDALTEFLKKQALKGANELINYYSKKYKKEFKHYGGHKGAHVVGHYADGARLVGLTENELYTQLKGLKQQSNLSKFFYNLFIKIIYKNSRRSGIEFAICKIISPRITQINRRRSKAQTTSKTGKLFQAF